MSDKDVTEVVLADAAGIARAVRILESCGLVAVPTETVYGLAARADSPDAVAKIFAAKGRPDFNPLIVHVRDEEQARRYGVWDESAEIAVMIHWPGPLTVVVPALPDLPLANAVTAGLDTVALRCPAHPVMRSLLQQIEFPLAAPSANRSGFISPTSAQHVLETLDGKVDLILDGGPAEAGVESSILAIREGGIWEELRPGPVDLDALHRHYFDTALPRAAVDGPIEAPGQLSSHYAPGKPVRLNAEEVAPDEFLIGFGSVTGDCTLSSGGVLEEAAANLYECLHRGASSPKPRIAVATVPQSGIGRAINDRLRRAAAPVV